MRGPGVGAGQTVRADRAAAGVQRADLTLPHVAGLEVADDEHQHERGHAGRDDRDQEGQTTGVRRAGQVERVGAQRRHRHGRQGRPGDHLGDGVEQAGGEDGRDQGGQQGHHRTAQTTHEDITLEPGRMGQHDERDDAGQHEPAEEQHELDAAVVGQSGGVRRVGLPPDTAQRHHAA